MDDQMLHHFMEDLTSLIVGVSMVGAGAWILSLIIAAFRQRLRLRAQTDFHNRMMEKFSSAEEFTTYLQSDAGKSFFEDLTDEPATPLNKILSSIQKGTILTLLGLGLFILGKVFTEPQLDKFFSQPQGGNILIILGVISFMIGTGFLISSAISYRLAKSWGMISPANTRVSNVPDPVQS
jgi:hypothetical protein